jgi:hypothetical protein
MRKGLWVVFLAVLATVAWASTPVMYSARADDTSGEPADAVSDEQLISLFAAAEVLNTTESAYITADDGNYYVRSGGNTWHWIMVLFRTDNISHSHTVKWEGYTDNRATYAMEAYVWNWDNESFTAKDLWAPTGSWTTARSFTINSDFWSWDPDSNKYQCMVLIQGQTQTGLRAMHIDVVRELNTANEDN